MAPSITIAKPIVIVIEVNAIKLYDLPKGSPDSDIKELCKIYDRKCEASKGDIKNFTTEVKPNDSIIWHVKVNKESEKEGYSALIKGMYGDDEKLLIDRTRGRTNGVVKGTVKSEFKEDDETPYKISFYLYLNGTGEKYYLLDPKLKGTKVKPHDKPD